VVEIAKFEAAHIDGIVRLCAEEGWPSWTPESVATAFAAPGVIALTALSEGNVVGAAQLLTDGRVVAYLGLLIVNPRFRGRGIGRALVGELFERSGLTRMDLLSEADSTAFYESLPHKVKPGYRIYRQTR